MAFIATLLGYLGTVTGVALALLMAICAFVSSPSQPAIPRQTVAIAAKPGEPKAAATPLTTTISAKSGPNVVPTVPEDRPVPQLRNIASARRAPMANDSSRDQNFHQPERLERAKHWAYQLEPDFETRYMGYINEPSADSSRFR